MPKQQVQIIKNVHGKKIFESKRGTYVEALLDYLEHNGNLRGLDHTKKNLTGLIVPENTDFSGSIFCETIFKRITSPKCIYDNSLFQNVVADTLILTGSTFKKCDMINNKFSIGNMSFCDLSEANMVDNTFKYMKFFKTVLNNAEIENGHIIDCSMPFASFVKTTCINVDFDGTKFAPKDYIGKIGKKFKKTAIDNQNKAHLSFIDWVSSLYAGAKFIGCNYTEKTEIPTIIDDFPSDYRYQNYARGAANVAITGGLYETFEYAHNFADQIMSSDVMRSHLVTSVAPYLDHIHPGTVGVLGAGVLLSFGLFSDKMKDFLNDMARKAVGGGWQMMRIANVTLLDSLRDMAHLTVLAGKKSDMAPIKAALIATSLNWSKINKKWEYQNKFWDVMMDRGRIIVCNKAHLDKALELLGHFDKKSFKHLHRRVTLVSHDHRTTDHPAAVSVAPNRDVRAVWRVQDEDYDGHITFAWSGNGSIMHTASIPPLEKSKMEAIMQKYPEINRTVRGGPETCIRKMIDPFMNEDQPRPSLLRKAAEKFTELAFSEQSYVDLFKSNEPHGYTP